MSDDFPADDEIQALLEHRTESANPELTEDADPPNDLLDAVEAGFDAALSRGSSGRGPVMPDVSDARPFELQELTQSEDDRSNERQNTESSNDAELDLHIELGHAELLTDEAASLRPGAVVPLGKLAGDPVDILVDGRLMARGEVLELNDSFCVRVAEIISRDY